MTSVQQTSNYQRTQYMNYQVQQLNRMVKASEIDGIVERSDREFIPADYSDKTKVTLSDVVEKTRREIPPSITVPTNGPSSSMMELQTALTSKNFDLAKRIVSLMIALSDPRDAQKVIKTPTRIPGSKVGVYVNTYA